MSKKLIFLTSFVLVLNVAGNASADLVAHWKLEEGSGTTTTAAIGSPDADGTLVGATWVTADVAPISVSTAAVFFESANSDRIETNYVGILGQAERTVTAWIKAEPTQNNNAVFVGWGLNNPTERYSFRLNASASNGSQWALRLEIQGSYAITQTPLNDGQWHHVAVTNAEGSSIEQVSFYVDGQLEDGLSGTSGGGVMNTASSSVVLGNSGHSVGGYGFDGAIDDVRIYDHVLSAAEIKALSARPKGYNPTPADGNLLETTWVNLSWQPGTFAVSHDVYIGDNFDDVSDSVESTFQGNQSGTSLIVGFPGFAYPDGLVPGTAYYWRIDEVNDADPNSPWKGNIWSFTIPPKTAYWPDPADGAESVEPDMELSWTGGFGAKLHTVYFGDNFDDVNNDAGGLPQSETTYTPGTLKLAKTYYWRVDEFDAIDTYKGDVWSFTTEGAVGNPNPSNGAADVEQTPILTWSPGVFAASHQVYFGTDKEAVENADTGSPEYKGSGNLGSESYDPGKLSWYTTYYWRIDEVNNVNSDSPWTGSLWNFTTVDFIVIEDFEDYNDYPPDEIYSTWIDGYGTTTNGSTAGYAEPDFLAGEHYVETTIVHGGGQSMPLLYDNNFKYSEAAMTLVSVRDWTEEGVGVLSLWFYGDASNAAEPMYVALNGSAVVYHGNPDAAQIATWTRWTIDLQEFAAQGVNLANVNTIAIGFGDKNNLQAGGSGMVFFDDIRLYRPAEPEPEPVP